jgi:nucleotide-binding universal stress UspA family protein
MQGLSALWSLPNWWNAVLMNTTKGFKRILLATDGSPESEAALLSTIGLAHTSSAKVRVAHVWKLELRHRHSILDAAIRGEAKRLVDTAVGRLQAAGVLADSEIVHADIDHVAAAIAIIAKSFDADLIVVGSRGLSNWQAMFKHSVSHQLMCTVDCPVLIVRNQLAATDHEPQRIVLAIAGGDDIAPATSAAIAAAAAAGSSVLVVHVAQTIVEPEGFVFVESDEETEATMSAAMRMVRDAGVAVEGVVAHGRPVAETVAETADSWNADMIVIGSSRMGDIASMVFDSVSHHVLRATGRPVLIAERIGA